MSEDTVNASSPVEVKQAEAHLIVEKGASPTSSQLLAQEVRSSRKNHQSEISITQDLTGAISTQESDVESDEVLSRFKEGTLLARVMDPPRPTRGADGLELAMDSWNEELDLMDASGGMQHASTTLIMEGKDISLYHKPFGFLIDGRKVQVEHVAPEDTGSNVGSNGELQANQTDMHSLEDLKNYYADKIGQQSVNEVNVGVKKDALIGLVINQGVTSPSVLAGFEGVRQMLGKRGINLQAYEYDQRKGELTPYKAPKRDELLSGLRPEIKLAYEKAI